MMTQINISLKYSTQYKPNILKIIKNKKTLSVYQFFYFFLFLYTLNNSYAFNNSTKFNLFILKKVVKLPTFLRAPYKHKKAQISLFSTSYTVYASYLLACNIKATTYSLINIIVKLFHIWSFFSSPLVSLTKQTCTYSINYNIINKRNSKSMNK